MGSIADVKHVVILMQENRSFDEYFGLLQGVMGFHDPNAIKQSDGTPIFAQKKANPPSGSPAVLSPFHTDVHTTNAARTKSLSHSWDAQHTAWAHGAMTGWRTDKADTVMAYFDRYDIPYHTALAQTFLVCDRYHSSVLGPTGPNRLYLMSGSIDPSGSLGGPVTGNPPKVPMPLYRWQSYPRALSNAGVSWAIYDEQTDDHPAPFDLNVARYFTDWVESPNTHRTGAGRFEDDIANGHLPTVSWIIPPYNYSEHPSYPPANGAAWMASKIDQLLKSARYWPNTVFILTYDENDGTFDHVVPPVAPFGTVEGFGEYVGTSPIGPGFRVPCIVISPWTVGGSVSSTPFDHTSVLRLLESVTNVPAVNLSAYRRDKLFNLASVLDFSSSVASADVPPLPTPQPYTKTDLPDPVPPTSQPWPPVPVRRSAIGWLGDHAYFFRGKNYLRFTTGETGAPQQADDGYPKTIAANWPELSSVDAGVAMPDGKAYVFHANQYVRYSAPAGAPDAVAGEYTPDAGYPARIWKNWHKMWSADLDAVVSWNDGYTYFFKSTEFVRCANNTHVADGPPQSIEARFHGVLAIFPFGIDAAVVWSADKAYFFKGEEYLRYDLSSNKVDDGYPGPLSHFSPDLAALKPE